MLGKEGGKALTNAGIKRAFQEIYPDIKEASGKMTITTALTKMQSFEGNSTGNEMLIFRVEIGQEDFAKHQRKDDQRQKTGVGSISPLRRRNKRGNKENAGVFI